MDLVLVLPFVVITDIRVILVNPDTAIKPFMFRFFSARITWPGH